MRICATNKNTMKNISKKRQAELRHYNRIKKELEQELKLSGKWCCFFSGEPIPDDLTWKDVAWHHIIGRENDMLTDKKFVRPVANKYHAMYHDVPFSKLKNEWWWNGFMERLKELDYGVWYDHVLKL